MSIAGIEKVRETELEAERIRKSAEEQASQIVADGKREAKSILEQASKDAEKAYREAMEKAETEAEEIYNARISEQRKLCETIKSDARAGMDSIVDKIVGKVVESYGNS